MNRPREGDGFCGRSVGRNRESIQIQMLYMEFLEVKLSIEVKLLLVIKKILL